MSIVTSIILIFPYSEDEYDRIQEINSFSYRNMKLDLKWIDSNEFEGMKIYGGTKGFNSAVMLGSYNNFPLEDFFIHLQTKVNWIHREYVQILIKSETDNDWTLKVYSDAGTKLEVNSIKF